MTARRIFRTVVHLCRFGLAALFLFTAGAKLWILKTFAGSVAELLSASHVNYERWQWPVTVGVRGTPTISSANRFRVKS